MEMKLDDAQNIIAGRMCSLAGNVPKGVECNYAFPTELGLLSFYASKDGGFETAEPQVQRWLDQFFQWRCKDAACTDRDVARPPFKE